MSLATLGVAYVAVGVAIALVALVARRCQTATDALLLFGLWPLWAPLVFARAGELDHDAPRLGRADAFDDRERELLRALARAQTSPLAAVLPDAESARVLAARVREANVRLGELDAVLARPDFDPAGVELRAKELARRGATAAAATAQLRLRTLGQMRSLRERYRIELDEVDELIAQLVTQAELLRLAPESPGTHGDLVRELVDRVEGLGDLFTYQATLEEGAEYPAAAGRST